MLITDTVDFRAKKSTKDRWKYQSTKKIHWENHYRQNCKNIEAKPTELKGAIDKSTIVVGDFSNPHLAVFRS